MSRHGASHLLDLSGGLIAASWHEDGGVVAQSMTKDPQTDEVRPMPTVPHSDQLRNPLLAEDFHNIVADEMSEKIDRKLKTALDETRRFVRRRKAVKSSSELLLIVLSIAILIAPSMQHRIVEAGQSTARLILTTNRLASTALMPLTAGLALSTYVVVQLTVGAPAGLAVAAFLGSAAAFCWFGLEIFVVGRHQEPREMQHSPTPLKTKSSSF